MIHGAIEGVSAARRSSTECPCEPVPWVHRSAPDGQGTISHSACERSPV